MHYSRDKHVHGEYSSSTSTNLLDVSSISLKIASHCFARGASFTAPHYISPDICQLLVLHNQRASVGYFAIRQLGGAVRSAPAITLVVDFDLG